MTVRAQKTGSLEKIQSWVLERTESGATADYFIVLRERADLTLAEELPTKEAKGWVCLPGPFGHHREDASARPRLARLHGCKITDFLHRERHPCKSGTRELALALAQRDDVDRIEGNLVIHNRLPIPETAGDEGSKEPDAQTPFAPVEPKAVEWNITKTGAPDCGLWDTEVRASWWADRTRAIAGRTRPEGKIPRVEWHRGGPHHNWHDAIHSGGGVCGADSPSPATTTATAPTPWARCSAMTGGKPGGHGAPGPVDRMQEHECGRRNAGHLPGVFPVSWPHAPRWNGGGSSRAPT